MPVDTTSYGNIVAPPTPVNPLQFMSGAANLQNTLNQNKLFGQQYQTNLAASQLYKAAMNPDGSLDQGKFANALATQPNAGYGVGPVLEQSQQIQGQNIINNQAKYNLLKDHLTTLANYLGPLASGNPTANDVAATIGHAISTGVATPQEAANFWQTLPRDQQGNIDQTQIKSWAQDNLQRVQSAAQQYGIINPAPTPVSTGGQTHLLALPANGQPRDVGQIANTLPPTTPSVGTVKGQPNTPTVIGPTTSTLQLPGQSAPAQVPQASPQAHPSPLAASMPGLSGNGGGNPPAAQVAPASTAAPSGPVQTGLAPGVATAMEGEADSNMKQGQQLQIAADQIPAQKAILQNLGTALNNFTAGPGADWRKVAGAFTNVPLQALGLKGIDTKNISSQEEFDKLATNLAQSQFATLGGTGTDAKLDSAMHTSPNSAMSKLGNQNIIALLKGNADAIAVKNQEWQKYQQAHGPQSYGTFSTQFNQSFSPRVFQSQYMTPQDRSSMVKDMSKPELNQFRMDYNLAVHNGWIPDPRANAGQ